MFERIKASKKAAGEGGFTLIELLVVIIILGILAAVVVFAVGGISDKGQTSACKIDTRTMRTSLEAYSGSNTGGNGTYTADEAVLVSKGFLSEESGLHDIRLITDIDPATTGNQGGFAIVVDDTDCGSLGADTGTSGPAPASPATCAATVQVCGNPPAAGTQPTNI